MHAVAFIDGVVFPRAPIACQYLFSPDLVTAKMRCIGRDLVSVFMILFFRQ